MRADIKQPKRGMTGYRNAAIPDGVGGTITGGTITGGPMQPLDLMSTLNRAARKAASADAVFGATQMVVSKRIDRDSGVALSDGSRIIFASMDDVRVLSDA